MLKIDFENTFEPLEMSSDLTYMTFYSEEKNVGPILIKIQIRPISSPLLPNVHNLAFGPILKDGEIDDKAKVSHTDTNKVFSTILFFALIFLQKNREFTIGIDGSTESRAYLYHRMNQSNKESLEEYFVTIGVDWYVKLLRNNDVERNGKGEPFFKPRPEPFDHQRLPNDLYRYYMFHLK
jgi:hypothetical protein